MSHFNVLVIGENHEGQLAPYHEFECTGEDDQYVQDVDITEKARKEYEADSSRKYFDPEGNQHDPYDDKFYREPTEEEKSKIGMGSGCGNGLSWTSRDWGDGEGYRTKVHFLPDGWEERKVPTPEIQSFAEFIEDDHGLEAVNSLDEVDREGSHKYGYVLLGENGEVMKAIDRTNPNAEWDWYQVGGRWTGWLKLKPGRTGAYGMKSWASDHPLPGTADVALKGDIDFDAMMDQRGQEAAAKYDAAKAITSESWEAWSSVRDRLEIEEARKFYHDQPAIKALKTSKDERFNWDIDDDLSGDREAYIQKARNRACVPYALVKDGQWLAKGEMGWWGMSHDKVDQESWNSKVMAELLALTDDTLITVVDCHI